MYGLVDSAQCMVRWTVPMQCLVRWTVPSVRSGGRCPVFGPVDGAVPSVWSDGRCQVFAPVDGAECLILL